MSDYSLNEVASRAKLAAKGAGYSWGMAEEVSRGVFWLISRGLPAANVLVQLLSSFNKNENVNSAVPQSIGNELLPTLQWLCPFAAGCALTESHDSLAADMRLSVSSVKYPLLIVPFIADLAARSSAYVHLTLDAAEPAHNTNALSSGRSSSCMSGSVITNGCAVHFSDPMLLHSVFVSRINCRLATDSEIEALNDHRTHQTPRVCVSHSDWLALDEFAQRTYAPATAASRVLGAGAELNDND